MLINWGAQRLWNIYYAGPSSPMRYEDSALGGVTPPPPIVPDLTFVLNVEADDALLIRSGTNKNYYL